jgi:hypothetical protein
VRSPSLGADQPLNNPVLFFLHVPKPANNFSPIMNSDILFSGEKLMSQGNLAKAEELYTDEEYIEFERQAEEKHELSNGEIIAMAGASREHNLITTNLTTTIINQVRGLGL